MGLTNWPIIIFQIDVQRTLEKTSSAKKEMEKGGGGSLLDFSFCEKGYFTRYITG